jgi:hypothetical protein
MAFTEVRNTDEEGDVMNRPQLITPSRVIAPRGLFTSEDEYREATERNEVEGGWVKWVRSYHWDYFITPSFKRPVNAEYARTEGERYIKQVAPHATAFFAWGGGSEHSWHLLLNLNDEQMRQRQRRKMVTRRLQILWQHGNIKVEAFDARRATKAVRYLVDHHEVDLIGNPKRHRARSSW